jgi:hypothetical protein
MHGIDKKFLQILMTRLKQEDLGIGGNIILKLIVQRVW